VHKEVMQVLFPKKNVPFNTVENRDSVLSMNKDNKNPGPGTYHQGRSDFATMMASRGIGDEGTYLINDNGHIN